MSAGQQHGVGIAPGARFEFGRNWTRFSSHIDDDRVRAAEQSLTGMLELKTIEGLSFLDVGCGSGLFSLAARRLGARVCSFDYDSESVECTRALRRRFFPDDPRWSVEPGSALDGDYRARCGRHDIVYSWGVLHHTGDMWQALANVSSLVADGGRLFIAIYNDQGAVSRRWLWMKRQYNARAWVRPALLAACFLMLYWRPLAKDFLRARPFHTLRQYERARGMSVWTDLVDWAGGHPFQVAKPEELFAFCRRRGFTLIKMATRSDLGCNELVFQRDGSPDESVSRRSGARPAGPAIR